MPWWKALLVFPLLILPAEIGRALFQLSRLGLRAVVRRWRERDRAPTPPQPMGLVFATAALLTALGVVSIIDHAHGWRDRLTALGLMLITASTIAVSPELLGIDILQRLDRWWLNSPLPAHQLAFSFHLRRLARFLVRVGALALVTVLVSTTGMIGISYLRLSDALRDLVDRSPRVFSAAFVGSLLVLAIGGSLRLWLGSPADLPAQPITVHTARESLGSADHRLALLRWAAVLFATGTVLSFIATVFVHQ
jgi:hypothetical protein